MAWRLNFLVADDDENDRFLIERAFQLANNMYSNFPILVAEDEESDIYFLKRGFLKAGVNAPLEFVRNGESAVAYLASQDTYRAVGL